MTRYALFKPLAALLGVAALLGAGAAQAHGDNIYWQIGVGTPGVYVGAASAPPVVVRPPVYYAPPPMVVVPAQPVMYGPPPGWRHRHQGWYGGPGYYRGPERFEHEHFERERGGWRY